MSFLEGIRRQIIFYDLETEVAMVSKEQQQCLWEQEATTNNFQVVSTDTVTVPFVKPLLSAPPAVFLKFFINFIIKISCQ